MLADVAQQVPDMDMYEQVRDQQKGKKAIW